MLARSTPATFYGANTFSLRRSTGMTTASGSCVCKMTWFLVKSYVGPACQTAHRCYRSAIFVFLISFSPRRLPHPRECLTNSRLRLLSIVPFLQFPRLRSDALIFCWVSQIRQVARNGHTADDRYVPGKARLLRIGTQWARPGSRSLHERDLIRGGSEIHALRIYRPWTGAVFNPIGERGRQISSTRS